MIVTVVIHRIKQLLSYSLKVFQHEFRCVRGFPNASKSYGPLFGFSVQGFDSKQDCFHQQLDSLPENRMPRCYWSHLCQIRDLKGALQMQLHKSPEKKNHRTWCPLQTHTAIVGIWKKSTIISNSCLNFVQTMDVSFPFFSQHSQLPPPPWAHPWPHLPYWQRPKASSPGSSPSKFWGCPVVG